MRLCKDLEDGRKKSRAEMRRALWPAQTEKQDLLGLPAEAQLEWCLSYET